MGVWLTGVSQSDWGEVEKVIICRLILSGVLELVGYSNILVFGTVQTRL